MALGGCYNCLKYLMFVFNFIFWLVGCALLSVGIWAKVDESSLEELLHDSDISSTISVASWIIIVVGSVVMVLGFLGCCGAIRESQCMLATFFIFLFIIFLALIGVGVFVYMGYKADPESIRKEVVASLKDDVYHYYNNTESKKKLDKLHAEYDCCGAEKGDFRAIHGELKAIEVCGLNWLKEKGCADYTYEQAEKILKNFFVIFVAVAFGIATIMLLGMIFSMLLCCAIRETVA